MRRTSLYRRCTVDHPCTARWSVTTLCGQPKCRSPSAALWISHAAARPFLKYPSPNKDRVSFNRTRKRTGATADGGGRLAHPHKFCFGFACRSLTSKAYTLAVWFSLGLTVPTNDTQLFALAGTHECGPSRLGPDHWSPRTRSFQARVTGRFHLGPHAPGVASFVWL